MERAVPNFYDILYHMREGDVRALHIRNVDNYSLPLALRAVALLSVFIVLKVTKSRVPCFYDILYHMREGDVTALHIRKMGKCSFSPTEIILSKLMGRRYQSFYNILCRMGMGDVTAMLSMKMENCSFQLSFRAKAFLSVDYCIKNYGNSCEEFLGYLCPMGEGDVTALFIKKMDSSPETLWKDVFRVPTTYFIQWEREMQRLCSPGRSLSTVQESL